MSTAPRRLAMVITELEPGGAERMLVEFATRIDRARYDPCVYSLAPRPDDSRAALVQRLADAQISTQFMGVRHVGQYFAAVGTLADYFRQQRTELVQSFLFHANVVAARAALAAGVPRLLIGIRVADPRWWRNQLERLATLRADRFVCVSQSVAEYVRRQGFASEKLTVIPNGVDLEKWRTAVPADRAALGVPPDRKILLFIGRLDAQKGLDRFILEVPKLLAEMPDYDFVLVGGGPLDSYLKRRVAAWGLGERVHFLGWREDVAHILQASSLLVLPSRWEGMPNVVLETMAAGKPVVATQSEGTVELLGLGALQQTVSVGDWSGLRERVIEVGRNGALMNRLGKQNQERAEQFSLDQVADRYQRLYDALASPVSGGGSALKRSLSPNSG